MASDEELRTALSGLNVSELKEMGARLEKSHADMAEMLQEMQDERKVLDQEREYFEQTIELMMKELHKLNIGAGNISDPLLEEGPLDFVGRFWEKMRPRDTAVVVSEHVGELKGPVAEGSPTAQDIAKQVTGQLQEGIQAKSQQALEHGKVALEQGKQVVEQGKQVWGRFSQSTLGPLWQRAEGALGGYVGGAAAAATTPPKPKKEKRERKAKAGADAPQEDSGNGAKLDPASVEAPASATAPEPRPKADAPAAAEPATSEADAKAQQQALDEQISSTILIEASLKLDDGTVQTLQVRAADRCKEVSHRFVQENSLKAWFEEPLTAWLKKVEADAEKFPVKIEGDLMEIRKAHSKK